MWKYAYNFRKGTVPHNYVSLMGGYPKRQTREVNRFPEGITAGFRWKENGNEYYFKGGWGFEGFEGLVGVLGV